MGKDLVSAEIQKANNYIIAAAAEEPVTQWQGLSLSLLKADSPLLRTSSCEQKLMVGSAG